MVQKCKLGPQASDQDRCTHRYKQKMLKKDAYRQSGTLLESSCNKFHVILRRDQKRLRYIPAFGRSVALVQFDWAHQVPCRACQP